MANLYNYNKLDSMNEYLKLTLDYIGLGSFKYELHSAVEKPAYYLNFGMELDYMDLQQNPKDLIQKLLIPISDLVKNSDAVKDARFNLEQDIKFQQTRAENAEKEIARLRQFETYYNLHYKLTHGEKDAN